MVKGLPKDWIKIYGWIIHHWIPALHIFFFTILLIQTLYYQGPLEKEKVHKRNIK